MKSFRFLLALITLELLATGSPLAADSQLPWSSLHWRCWYDRHIEIICLLQSLPDLQPVIEEPSSRLPLIVQDLRRNPEVFLNVPLHIPLFSPPFQPEFAAQLARAIVCGPRPECTVDFTMVPPSPDEMDALVRKTLPAAGQEEMPESDSPN